MSGCTLPFSLITSVISRLPGRTGNDTLAGHSLLVLTPWQVSNERLDSLGTRFPGLETQIVIHDWDAVGYNDVPPKVCWDDVTILVTGSCLPLKGEAPKLQYVQLLSAGVNFLLENSLFQSSAVAFCTANGVHGPQIAEWVIATYLMAQHKLLEYWQFQQESRWSRLDVPDDATGHRVGILGYGSIGRQVARICKALGMSVHAYTLHPRTTPESRRDQGYIPGRLGDLHGSLPDRWYSGASTGELHNFLASKLDLLVICTPLTANTTHLISEPEFKILGRNRTFISNVSRGPIVHTEHLIAALENDTIRGAAIDVMDPEPLPKTHALWTTKNLILTPHISYGSTSYIDRVMEIVQLNLANLSKGRPLLNQVSRAKGY